MSPRIDAHQHVWKVERGDYGWLQPELGVLYRDFNIPELLPHLDRAGLEGTLLVQAAPTVAETEFMLEVAANEPRVRGVVGWVDFESARGPEELARLAENPKLCGVRPMIQDIADPDWMLGKALAPCYRAVIDNGLVFDALVLPRHLENLLELCSRHPELCVVIDHGAKPEIRSWGGDAEARAAWTRNMTRLARESSCVCKLSGLVTEAEQRWTLSDLRPYVDVLLESFGPERLLFGSDWPVVNLAGGYDRWWDAACELTEELSNAERDALFGANAARVYGLAPPS